jgi:hypothetical protein
MQTLPLWRTHRKVNNVQLFFVEIMPWKLVTSRVYFLENWIKNLIFE